MASKKEESTTFKANVRHKENLSASVLFTFTPKLKYMMEMLQIGIVPRYVYERLPGTKRYYITQMKCFCDIPLGKVKNHMERYGFYGIGIKKSYLQQNGATPVIYIHKDSEPYFNFKKMKGTKLEEAPFLTLLKRYLGSDYYFEEGVENPIHKHIHFYDEREWRFVPKGFNLETSTKFEKIQDGVKFANNLNKNLDLNRAAFKIPSEEVEYIIIRNKKDLNHVIKELREIFGLQDMDMMLTKIIIAENILKDF
jgi:uncharacterized protein YcgL (UPF0745 family)